MNNKNYFFLKQIEIANELNLAIVVHLRGKNDNVFYDALKILKIAKAKKVLIHFFSGSETIAKLFIKQNFYFSFSGIITFKKNEQFKKIIPLIPFDKLVIETDSPFASPEPVRGKINKPYNLIYIYNFFTKTWPKKNWKKILFENAQKFFLDNK